MPVNVKVWTPAVGTTVDVDTGHTVMDCVAGADAEIQVSRYSRHLAPCGLVRHSVTVTT